MKKFKWIVEFEVDETWVKDGFNLTKLIAQNMIVNELPYANPNEISAKILESPKADDILKTQGYGNHCKCR